MGKYSIAGPLLSDNSKHLIGVDGIPPSPGLPPQAPSKLFPLSAAPSQTAHQQLLEFKKPPHANNGRSSVSLQQRFAKPSADNKPIGETRSGYPGQQVTKSSSSINGHRFNGSHSIKPISMLSSTSPVSTNNRIHNARNNLPRIPVDQVSIYALYKQLDFLMTTIFIIFTVVKI